MLARYVMRGRVRARVHGHTLQASRAAAHVSPFVQSHYISILLSLEPLTCALKYCLYITYTRNKRSKGDSGRDETVCVVSCESVLCADCVPFFGTVLVFQ